MFAPRLSHPREGAEARARGPSVVVRRPGDAHELAAERVAGGPLREIEPGTSPLPPVPAGPADLRRALGEAGQPLPPRARSYFEARLGRDFAAVRVHAGHRAGASARRLGAAAYTLGSDIAFAPGRYDPEGAGGRRLLAHELAHVTQQAGGSAALPVASPPTGIQRALETIGGSWNAETYELNPHGYGVNLDRLVFEPNDRVDATSIALVQMVSTVKAGAPEYGGDATRKERSLSSGHHMDSPSDSISPLYHMKSPTVADPGLADAVPQSNSEYGYHTNLLGMTFSKPAWMRDFPAINRQPANSSQTFETAALAVGGAQAGTYYGSVTWGWRSDAENRVSLEPLALGEMGAPSTIFLLASEAWNDSKDSTGADSQDLPLASPSPSIQRSRTPGAMSDLQLRLRLLELDKAIEGTTATNPFREALGKIAFSLDSLRFEKSALEAEIARRNALAMAAAAAVSVPIPGFPGSGFIPSLLR